MVYIIGNMNGTRCRDGVKVLWCHSHLVWLVFRVPSLHALVFIQKTFCDLFLLFIFLCVCFVLLFRNRYVQTPILATLVPSKFANFGNRQRLPNLAIDDTCQFWQLTTLAKFGN